MKYLVEIGCPVNETDAAGGLAINGAIRRADDTENDRLDALESRLTVDATEVDLFDAYELGPTEDATDVVLAGILDSGRIEGAVEIALLGDCGGSTNQELAVGSCIGGPYLRESSAEKGV